MFDAIWTGIRRVSRRVPWNAAITLLDVPVVEPLIHGTIGRLIPSEHPLRNAGFRTLIAEFASGIESTAKAFPPGFSHDLVEKISDWIEAANSALGREAEDAVLSAFDKGIPGRLAEAWKKNPTREAMDREQEEIRRQRLGLQAYMAWRREQEHPPITLAELKAKFMHDFEEMLVLIGQGLEWVDQHTVQATHEVQTLAGRIRADRLNRRQS